MEAQPSKVAERTPSCEATLPQRFTNIEHAGGTATPIRKAASTIGQCRRQTNAPVHIVRLLSLLVDRSAIEPRSPKPSKCPNRLRRSQPQKGSPHREYEALAQQVRAGAL